MRKSKNKPAVSEKIKYFFRETFRPHTKAEYVDFFTRGMSPDEGVTRKLPWLYIRVFALNLFIFAASVLAFRLARYSSDYVTSILFGGLLFNIPLFILLFELYPKRDFSFLKLLAVVIVGGAVSTVLITMGYRFIYSTADEPNAWISTLWVGFWEELIKGAVAISTVAILKKKNPLLCFLIGFAVGTGYSFYEDLGYIYSLSRSYGTALLVLTSVGRGLSCVCSHAPWTAMICWAFAKFKKPFLNFRFYGVAIGMMALHYFADVPFFDENLDVLRGVTVGWAIEAVVVITIFVAVFFALKNAFKEIYAEGKPEYPQAEPPDTRLKLSQTANVTAILCAAALSVFAFAGCSMPVGERAVYKKIYDDKEFIEYVQDGAPLKVDLKREFSPTGEIYSEFISEGNRVGATQKVQEGEQDYFYVYKFDGDGTSALVSIGAKVNDNLCYLRQFVFFEDRYYAYYYNPDSYEPVDDSLWGVEEGDGNGEVEPPEEQPEEKPVKVVSFFNVNAVSCNYSMEEKCYLVDTGETEFAGLAGIIALSVLSGVTLIGGCAAYITLKIKARRQENA